MDHVGRHEPGPGSISMAELAAEADPATTPATRVSHRGNRTAVDPSSERAGNKWLTLVAVCLGTFMLLLDVTIVNVALPDIQTALKSSFSDLQWVVDAYALTLAALLLTAGSLADMFGRRLLYVIGLVDLHGRVAAVRRRAGHPVAPAVARRSGRRRRDHVLRLAGPAGRRVPRQGPRHRLRRLGRDHRPGRGHRPAARRRADVGPVVAVDLLRQPARSASLAVAITLREVAESKRAARPPPRLGRASCCSPRRWPAWSTGSSSPASAASAAAW